MDESDKDMVSALARGMALLKIVGQTRKPVSNIELAKATGIPKNTVSRLLATLTAGGFLRQVGEGDRFSLGPALLKMTHQYLRQYDLRSLARPHLKELADATDVSVYLGVPDKLDIFVIDSIEPEKAFITTRIGIGLRMAMATSAAGRAYIASLPETDQKEVLEQIQLGSGDDWRTVKARLEASIDEYTRQGFCTSFGEWHPDINALGICIMGPQGEHYAISCGGPAYILPASTLLERVAPRLLAAAMKIGTEIGITLDE